MSTNSQEFFQMISNLISSIQSSQEYVRSNAIAESIQLFSKTISNLKTQITEYESQIEKLNDNIFKYKTENELILKETNLYKNKLSVTEQLNKTLEKTITDLTNKINEKINENQIQMNNIINNNNKNIENINIEKLELENKIKELYNENNEYKNKINEIENENMNLKKNMKNNEMLNKKLKNYEILMYKLDLENQNYKQTIKNYQNKLSTITGESIDNMIPINKIDINNELNTIENEYRTKTIDNTNNSINNFNSYMNNDNFNNNYSNYNNNFNNNMLNSNNNALDYENSKINETIPITSFNLNSQNLLNINNSNILDNSNDEEIKMLAKEINSTKKSISEFNNIILNQKNNKMSIIDINKISNELENQKEKLDLLKSRYNSLIKK